MATLEELFPIALSERAVRFPETDLNPATLLRSELSRVAAAHRERTDPLLTALALACFHLSQVVAEPAVAQDPQVRDRLDIIRADLDDVLQGQGVEVRDLTGRVFTTEDQRWVDVRGHRTNPELEQPVVWHMERPVVFHNGRCLNRGVVILETPSRDA